jgi:hypothetical protein
VTFYWADSGEKEVKCTCTGNEFAIGTLFVKKPTVDTFTADQGVVKWFGAGTTEFGLNGADGIKQGMEFKATVNVPAPFNAGKWQFVQTIVPSRFITTTKSGTKMHDANNGKTCLDQAVPYPYGEPKVVSKPAGPYDTGNPGEAYDTPRMGVDAKVITRASIDTEKYKMYIMFQPPGANPAWVPLQYWGWNWKGTATFAAGAWTLTDNVPGVDPKVTETPNHPVWNKLVGFGEWKID